jgi:NADPH-dependent 2,4-dienoyl-CoA reductase/sulfur reductase-like enzyme
VRLVVVGADAAGMSGAHQAMRVAGRRGVDLSVIALERTGHTSYSACGIPYWIAGDVADGSRDGGWHLVARTVAQHRAVGIDLRLGTEVEELDLDAGVVVARDTDGGSVSRIGFDQLLLATGARPRVPRWALDEAGHLTGGVHPVRSLDDGVAWIDALLGRDTARRPEHAVVVGGGYIGVEMAEALLRRDLSVTLLTRREVMSSTLDPDMGALVREQMQAAGIEVICGSEVDGLGARDGAVRCVSVAGREFPADVVALGTGVEPETEFAAAAGLPLGKSGGLLPDERQSVAEGVWAGGDCCESLHRLTGERAFVPLGTHANKQGRVAGENLAGGSAAFAGILGTAVTRFVGGGVHVEIARTGLDSAEAEKAGRDVESLVTHSTTIAGYLPDPPPIDIKVLAERAGGRIAGVQLVGGAGSGKRIDIAAAAIWTGQTVHDVASMDLSYVPPLSPVWEPVQIACRRLSDRLR